jgi:hypothetical protein
MFSVIYVILKEQEWLNVFISVHQTELALTPVFCQVKARLTQ